jgi:hypothetical protein
MILRAPIVRILSKPPPTNKERWGPFFLYRKKGKRGSGNQRFPGLIFWDQKKEVIRVVIFGKRYNSIFLESTLYFL